MSDVPPIILKADAPSVKFQWTLELLDQYAAALGCGPQETALRNFLRVALQFLPPLPYEAKVDHKARVFYVNTETNEPLWENPLQPTFIFLIKAFDVYTTQGVGCGFGSCWLPELWKVLSLLYRSRVLLVTSNL